MESAHAAFEDHDHDHGFPEKPSLPPRPARKPINAINAVHVPARKPVSPSQRDRDLVEKTRDLKLDTSESPPPFYEEDTLIFDSPHFVQSPTSASTTDSPNLVQSPTSVSTSTSISDGPSSEPSKWKTAVGDARHFAGGLISHPVESTKHFSILRHSHGLVYYKGPSTNLAITIFADNPLPQDRTLWVQRKGWTGKTGMKVKSLLHNNSSWINVTPSERVEPAQLPPADERAWQRDINKFLKKAPKEIRHHTPRETNVLRIPASVEDGYFRVVLCAGEGSRSVLCPSPVFRVASTSTSSSSIRGASLATLPMEIGIKVFSSTAVTAAGNFISPVTSAIQNQISQHQPGLLVQEAASTAYGASGIQNKIDDANQQFAQTRDVLLESGPSSNANYDDLDLPETVGSLSGPDPPFPIRISRKIVAGTGRSTVELGMPTVNLSGTPEDVIHPLLGVYFGWAAISTKASLQPGTSQSWHKAIITIAPCPYTPPSIIPKKLIKAHLLHDFRDTQLQHLDAKISVLILGFLRPVSPPEKYADRDSILFETTTDIAITQASLGPDREAWSAEACVNQLKLTKSNRSMTECYVDLRQSGRRQVDRLPFHKAGIRAPGALQRDRMLVHGNGGIYVLR